MRVVRTLQTSPRPGSWDLEYHFVYWFLDQLCILRSNVLHTCSDVSKFLIFLMATVNNNFWTRYECLYNWYHHQNYHVYYYHLQLWLNCLTVRFKSTKPLVFIHSPLWETNIGINQHLQTELSRLRYHTVEIYYLQTNMWPRNHALYATQFITRFCV